MSQLSIQNSFTALTYLALHISLVCSLVYTRNSGGPRDFLIRDGVDGFGGAGIGRGAAVLGGAAGGTSRGGSSTGRDELRDRLGSLGTLLKGLNGVLDNRPCNLNNPEDLLHMLPGAFLTEDDLMNIVPGSRNAGTNALPRRTYTPSHRIVPGHMDMHQTQFDMALTKSLSATDGLQVKANGFSASFLTDFSKSITGQCNCCVTEIGYEIVSQVTDFTGQNHTVINFNNAFQFIPSGRCANENSPCGNGGRAICKQMTRAHWSLVWTPGRGVNLVAHEVPSHCECLNVGGPDVPLRTSSFTASKVPLPANAFGNLDTPPLTNAFAASSSSNSLSGNVGFVHDDKNYNNRDADSDSVVNLDVNPFTGSSQFTDVSLFKSPATFESFPAHP